jgi:hypothetical protein
MDDRHHARQRPKEGYRVEDQAARARMPSGPPRMSLSDAPVAGEAALIEGLVAICRRPYVITLADDQAPYLEDWRGRYHGRTIAVVKPADTAEVAAVVRLCAEQGWRWCRRAAIPVCAARRHRMPPAAAWCCGWTG